MFRSPLRSWRRVGGYSETYSDTFRQVFVLHENLSDTIRPIGVIRETRSDTIRRLSNLNEICCDTYRKVLMFDEGHFDTSRQIGTMQEVRIDTLRKLANLVETVFDSLRQVVIETIGRSDTHRNVSVLQGVLSDTFREVIELHEPSFDTFRKIVAFVTHPAGYRGVFRSAFGRKTHFVLGSDQTFADTFRQVMLLSRNPADTYRKVDSLLEGRADTLRRVHSRVIYIDSENKLQPLGWYVHGSPFFDLPIRDYAEQVIGYGEYDYGRDLDVRRTILKVTSPYTDTMDAYRELMLAFALHWGVRDLMIGDLIYRVRVDGQIETEFHPHNLIAEIPLACQPYVYSKTVKMLQGSGIAVNEGNVEACPTITITGPLTAVQVVVNGAILKYPSLGQGDKLVIDCERQTVKLNGVNALKGYSGGFPCLEVGENEVIGPNMIMTWRDRWI